MLHIGEKIKSAREDLNLKQRDVAGQIPMNQSRGPLNIRREAISERFFRQTIQKSRTRSYLREDFFVKYDGNKRRWLDRDEFLEVPSNYSKIECDLQKPGMEQLRQICLILHLDPRYLLEPDEYKRISLKDLTLLKQIKTAMKEYYEK